MTSDWNQRYVEKNTPWDSGLPSRELRRVLDAGWVAPCRAAELGCGTGTNAVFLAQCGFDVVAFDLSSVALDAARRKAAETGVSVDFREADLCALGDRLMSCPAGSHGGGDDGAGDHESSQGEPIAPFDFIFDRGCFHCARRVDLGGYQRTLQALTRPGSKLLVLTGNADETTEQGPPRLTQDEIRADLGGLFDIQSIRAFRFEDPGGIDGPLGWAACMTRKARP